MDFTDQQKHRLVSGISLFLLILSVFFVIKVVNEIKAGAHIGNVNTISVNGKGEVFAIPDIATINFTAKGEGKDIKVAQTKEADLVNKAIDYLKGAGIAEKDIKTVSYYSQPKYEYFRGGDCYNYQCPTPKVIGYEISQTTEVKIRDTSKAGDILSGLGNVGVTDLSGPNFAIDDVEKVKAEARAKAIENAMEKSKVLAKDLGVRIVSVMSYYEPEDYPVMYGKSEMLSLDAGVPAPSPVIPTGENKIVSNVTITFEIR